MCRKNIKHLYDYLDVINDYKENKQHYFRLYNVASRALLIGSCTYHTSTVQIDHRASTPEDLTGQISTATVEIQVDTPTIYQEYA